MKENSCWRSLLLVLTLFCLLSGLRLAAQAPPAPAVQGQGFVTNYSSGPSWFPRIFSPYRQHDIPPVRLENSPRLQDLIHDGKLELSLSDALALAIEDNLDISVQRFVVPMSQADVLRTKAGSAARGFTGALVPPGLSVAAIGAGVSTAVAGGGVGSTGGITGGGGAVNIPPVGTFDPTINFNFSWDRTSSPLNTLVVAGVPAVTSYATSYAGSYTQMMPNGTSFFVSLNGLRSSSTQRGLLFNPAVLTRTSMGFNQPLLSGAGMVPNERFLMVARNNQRISGEIFRSQVSTTIVAVENAYWDMAAFQENVKVAEQALQVAQKLYDDDKVQVQLGTLVPLDLVSAQSEVVARQRDVVVAKTNLQMQETLLKRLLSKQLTPELQEVELVTTDRLPEPRDADIPDLQTALSDALQGRSDLQIAQVNVQNEQVSTRFTNNNLMPTADVFSQYAAAGETGLTISPLGTSGSASDALNQTIVGQYPEYSAGMSLLLPIRNRTAQADNLRAQLETQQAQVNLQNLHNQVALGVRQAVIGLVQGKAQVQSAHEASQLAQQLLDAEQQKLSLGASTPYQVILRQRDLMAAQLAEVQAVATYAKALVTMDQVRGNMLERSGILFDDALSGSVTKAPTPHINLQGFTVGGEKPSK